MKKIFIILICTLLLSLASCDNGNAGQATNHKTNTGRLKITASIFPYYDFAHQIVGDRADLVNIVPPGIEPHEYEPSAREIANIYNSDLFIYNGFGMEPWADRIKPDLEKKGVRVLRMSDYKQDIPDAVDKNSGQVDPIPMVNPIQENAIDPHIWLATHYAYSFSKLISDTIISLETSPANREFYRGNTAQYLLQINQLIKDYDSLATCKKKDFITSHSAFNYLAVSHGLTAYSVTGPTTEGEPSPKKLVDLINLIKSKNLTYIYADNLSTPKFVEVLARESGAQILILYTLENLTKEQWAQNETYISLMEKNLENLKKGLDCGAK